MSLNRVKSLVDRIVIRNVLVSVWDKAGLDDFALGLLEANPRIRFFSTGGTLERLRTVLGGRAADNLNSVSQYTGQPEMQGGLVKTLDYKIYLGLLGEADNPSHQADLLAAGAVGFDMTVVNLYPFEAAASAAGAGLEDARAHIDVGGPCMLRASAKNFLRVAPVCDPADYAPLLGELAAGGASLGLDTRFRLACKAFQHTAAYDRVIAAYLAGLEPAELGRSYRVRER